MKWTKQEEENGLQGRIRLPEITVKRKKRNTTFWASRKDCCSLWKEGNSELVRIVI